MSCDQLQKWADDNGVKGIRFYPTNPSESSANEIVKDAFSAIQAFENGEFSEFSDPIQVGALHPDSMM